VIMNLPWIAMANSTSWKILHYYFQLSQFVSIQQLTIYLNYNLTEILLYSYIDY
jgi:hypothetical protein